MSFRSSVIVLLVICAAAATAEAWKSHRNYEYAKQRICLMRDEIHQICSENEELKAAKDYKPPPPKYPQYVVGHGFAVWFHSDGSVELGPDWSGVFIHGPRQNWWPDMERGKGK